MGPMEVVIEGAGAKKIKQDFWVEISDRIFYTAKIKYSSL
jgi:hypothetical protein